MPQILWYRAVLMGVPLEEGQKPKQSISTTITEARRWAYAVLRKEKSKEGSIASVKIWEVREIALESVSLSDLPDQK